MFRRMFGGDAKGGQAVSQNAANKTVDAIQKLGEVTGLLRNAVVAYAWVSERTWCAALAPSTERMVANRIEGEGLSLADGGASSQAADTAGEKGRPGDRAGKGVHPAEE